MICAEVIKDLLLNTRSFKGYTYGIWKYLAYLHRSGKDAERGGWGMLRICLGNGNSCNPKNKPETCITKLTRSNSLTKLFWPFSGNTYWPETTKKLRKSRLLKIILFLLSIFQNFQNFNFARSAHAHNMFKQGENCYFVNPQVHTPCVFKVSDSDPTYLPILILCLLTNLLE